MMTNQFSQFIIFSILLISGMPVWADSSRENKIVDSRHFAVVSAITKQPADGQSSAGKSDGKISIEDVRASAGVCLSPEMQDSVFSYLKAFGNMLLFAGYARDEDKRALTGNVIGSITHFEKARQFYACAMLQVIEFRNSSDQNIMESSKAVVVSLNELYAVDGLMQTQFKDALNGKSIPQGDLAEIGSKISITSDNAWKRLLPEGLLITHSLVDYKNQGHLVLTKKQTFEVTKVLESAVKKGYKKDDRALEVTVKYLVNFLNNEGWKFTQ
jgi:hypothetical protein